MTPRGQKTSRQKAWSVLGLLILSASMPGSVYAQSGNVENRLNRLENEVQTLSRSVFRGEAPPPGAFTGDAQSQANAEVRLQQLEGELRSITGRLEEQDYKIRQMQDTLERALGDMQLRLEDLERRGGGAASPSGAAGYMAGGVPPVSGDQPYEWRSGNATASAPSGGAVANNLPPLSETVNGNDPAAALYESAFSMLKNGQYGAAQSEFDSFLAQYPDHVLSGNAKYWLGETYYVRNDFERAARIFAEAYQAQPKGPKAGDNLLKLGLSLAGAGNKSDACVALGQVEREFPTGAGSVLRRAQQEMARLGC